MKPLGLIQELKEQKQRELSGIREMRMILQQLRRKEITYEQALGLLQQNASCQTQTDELLQRSRILYQLFAR